MKYLIEYNYDTFTIYKEWGSAGTKWFWNMKKAHLADATFYKGNLRTVAAANANVIGANLTGFYDFRGADEGNSIEGEWQDCINDVDSMWWCVHAKTGQVTVRYIQVTKPVIVPVNTSMVVLEGSVSANDNGKILDVQEMVHVKPRNYSYTIDGDAKVFFINPK